MATKKKKTSAKRQQLDGDDINIVGIKKAEDLRPARKQKSSKYEDLVDRAARLRPGEVLEIEIAEGVDPEATRARISAAIRRRAQPQTPHKLKIRMTARGSVGIYCYPRRE